eukprot:CAMPEP_0181427562 /NCGR_PEP_ID=MMETSP1110-20121109/16235_1 /TAXON_ID=174948 /ORGANISM="Symbiodinium sp., Strain CCMP421" /LENGTH=90 /DNA_ID=CAMNT_0023550777 /DNA_START=210 /DNA_END=482 /DNA_ORIENTATION=+
MASGAISPARCSNFSKDFSKTAFCASTAPSTMELTAPAVSEMDSRPSAATSVEMCSTPSMPSVATSVESSDTASESSFLSMSMTERAASS